MAEEGITKVKLHKQDKEGLVNAKGPATSIPEKKEDPDELGSEDFKKAADDAQGKLSEVAQSAQQGVASVLGSIQETLVPKSEEKQDPEVKDFRASAAEAAAEAKAYMSSGSGAEKGQETKH